MNGIIVFVCAIKGLFVTGEQLNKGLSFREGGQERAYGNLNLYSSV
jgi:hypothetical protein